MKSKLLVSVLFLMCLQLHAQISFKAKAGLSLFRLHGENYDRLRFERTQRSITGFQVGTVAEKKIFRQFYINSEFLYTQKGHINLNTYSGRSVKLHYLELPLLIKWKANKNISLAAGPSIAYLVNASFKYQNDRMNIKEAYQRIDLGVNGDLSYENDKLGIGVRYTQSIKKTNMNDQIITDPEFTSNWTAFLFGRNQGFQFYATYSLF
jgi:hypothetical protein